MITGDQGNMQYNFHVPNSTSGYSIGQESGGAHPTVKNHAEWTSKDKALAGTFTFGQIINYSQAMYTLRNDNWRELNPVVDAIYNEYGREGIIAWKVSTTALMLYAADKLPKYRKHILWFSNVVVWSFVGHDLYVGVGFSW